MTDEYYKTGYIKLGKTIKIYQTNTTQKQIY